MNQTLNYRGNPECASSYDLLGLISLASRDNQAAQQFFDEALEIKRRYLKNSNPNHPDIGDSYYHLSKVLMHQQKFAPARRYLLKADEIYSHNFLKSHERRQDIARYLNELNNS